MVRRADRNLAMSDKPPLVRDFKKVAITTDKDVRTNMDDLDASTDKTENPWNAVVMRYDKSGMTSVL